MDEKAITAAAMVAVKPETKVRLLTFTGIKEHFGRKFTNNRLKKLIGATRCGGAMQLLGY